jgi:predicted permease
VHNSRESFASRVFRACLLAFPRDMRLEYSAEMRHDFATRLAAVASERGAFARWLFALHNYLDTLTTGVGERFAIIRGDVFYALRGAARAPLFAIIIVLTIGIAIGANATIDGFISRIVFSPIPVSDPGSLRLVWEVRPNVGTTRGTFTYDDAMNVRAQSKAFTTLGMSATVSAVLGVQRPRMLRGEAVSGEFFSTLQLHPQIGRLLARSDERESANSVVLSDALWRMAFGADPSVIGRPIRLGDRTATIIGVAPPRVYEPGGRAVITGVAFWQPLHRSVWQNNGYNIRTFGRARPGISSDAVNADLRRIFTSIAVQRPAYAGTSARAPLVADELYRDIGPVLWTFILVALGVLVVACANVANLFLSRGSVRATEIAVRFSLGATRRRVIWQLLTETMLYAIAGGAIGIVVAAFGSRALVNAVPPYFSFAREANVDWIVFGLTLVFIVVAAIVAGLGPALALSRPDVLDQLKGGGRGSDAARGGRMRRSLVVGEIAVAMAIVVTAALSVRTIDGMLHEPLGITPRGVYVADVVGLSWFRYNTAPKANAFSAKVQARIAQSPGIRAAAWTTLVPAVNTPSTAFEIVGRRAPTARKSIALSASVSPGAIQLLGIPLIGGRFFDARDRLGGAPVIIVSQSLARAYFGSVRAAIGARIIPDFSTYDLLMVPRTIVGVVGDVRPYVAAPTMPAMYTPLSQMPMLDMFLVVDTTLGTSDVAALVKAAIQSTDPQVPAPATFSLEHAISTNYSDQQTATTTLAVLALVALLLAIAGIYATVSFDVSRRTHEIGVRIALGARAPAIVMSIVRDVAGFTAVGLGAGIVLSTLAAKASEGQLVDFSFVNPTTYVATIVIILAAIAAATLVPALRSVRVQPVVALRYE